MSQIQWFPGHMNKAERQLQHTLQLIDVLVEVLDARIPKSSRNPLITRLIAKKPHIIVLNKADLADPVKTKKWQTKLAQQGALVLALDALHQPKMQRFVRLVQKADEIKIKKLRNHGVDHPHIRIAFCGVPNCGKSTIINRLVGHKAARVGNTPGVTKGQNWLQTRQNIQILDTPGILWPKFSDKDVANKLAAFGAIKDSLFAPDDVALFVLKYLKKNYQTNLSKFSRLSAEELQELNEPDLLLRLTKRYDMRDDYERFSRYLLQRLRKGQLGRITLD